MSHRAEIDRLLASPPPDWERQWANARVQLRALDYDASAHPDASEALMALYLTAGGRASGDRVVGTVPVPAAVRDEAMRAVRMAHRFNYGAWNFIGLARAIQLATIPRIDARSVERMRGFFTRHAKDAEAAGFGDDAHPSRGYLAHLVWGGDPAKEWVMGMEQRGRRNPESLVFYHGAQRWEGPPQIVAHRKGHAEHGPGIYLTTSWTTASKYAKGGGSVYRIEVSPSVRWLEKTDLPVEETLHWVKSLPRLRGKSDILASLERLSARVGKLPASLLVNAFVNNDAASGANGPALAEYLVNHGVDASHVLQGDEDWVVIFNPKVIEKVTRLSAKDVGEGFAFDLPRVRRNPLAQPSPTLAFSVRKGVVPGVVEVYLYEPDDIDDTERSMVAGMMASFTGKRPRWEASGVAACPGYGPLIYDLTATLLKQKLHATRDRSDAAKKFWKRQGKNYIEPLSPEDFRAKYGVSVDDLYDRGLELTPEDLRRMSDHLVSVFFGAKEAEKAGKPLSLARCAVPNGRRRR